MGRPTFVVATEAFAQLARDAAGAQGLPTSRIVSVEHPIGGIDAETLRRRAEIATEAILTRMAAD